MSAVIEQLEMLGQRGARVPDDYQQATALKCRSRHHALLKCIEISDLLPKQIYGAIGIDQGLWSRITAGTAFLNPDLKFEVMEVCGNDVPLRYDAWKRGYTLERVKSDLEAENARLRQELEDERRVVLRLGAMLKNS